MNIQAINSGMNLNYSQCKNTSFKGVWARIGQNYLNAEHYCAGAYYKFADGQGLKTLKDPRNGRRLIELGTIDMTAAEGKAAYKFLFGKLYNYEGYLAVKKLRDFMAANATKDGKHNVMFLEKDDIADITAKKDRINLGRLNLFLNEFEYRHNLIKPKAKVEVKEPEKIMTREELQKHLIENGVA